MIFVDDEPNCGCGCDKQNNAPVYPVAEKLDSLQTSVDKLNKSFFYVNTDIENLKETCAVISVQANNYTDAEINELRDNISQSIAESVNTAQVLATNVNADNVIAGTEITTPSLTADDVIATSNLTAPEADITEITSTTANLTSAEIGTAEITNLTAVNASLQNISMTDLDVSTIDATSAEIGTIESNLSKIKKIAAELITTDTTEYNHGEAVDNTHLFKLTIPFYDGITNIIEEQDDFNITIIDNSVITYTQADNKDYLKRVHIGTNSIEFFFENIGDDLWYKLVHLGSDDVPQPVAETVLKTGVEFNIVSSHGTIVYKTGSTEGGYLRYAVVDELPSSGVADFVYVVVSDNSYLWDEDSQTFIPLVDPDNFVPITRKVNDKALSTDITLTASDVGALPDSTTHLSGDVPVTRTVNSKALSNDITLNAADVGALPDDTYIPTKVSDLTNDSGYTTSSVVNNLITVAIANEAAARNTAISTSVSTAINALDVASVGGTGYYIESISEADGLITAVTGTFSAPSTGINWSSVLS